MSSRYTLTPAIIAALTNPAIVLFLVLRSKHEIRLDILIRAERAIPTMAYDRTYELRDMVGAEWWDTLPLWHRIIGGATFAYLVARGEFDLEFACHPERSNKIYRRV